MNRFFWLIFFFIGSTATLAVSFYLLSRTPPQTQILSSATTNPNTIISQGAGTDPVTFSSFGIADARPLIIRKYLHRYESPLEPYSDFLIETADKYSLDYRLLSAIAQQESNLCKKIPPGSHNCWGYGIYGDQAIYFDDYPQAIETVARALKKDYINQGLDTPEKIMVKYTPPSVEIGGPWAKAISQFLSDLE